MSTRHIAIAGNIGAGKTTLTRLLAEELDYHAHFEHPETNPYIVDFYSDMPRWAFQMQIHYLVSRIAKLKEIRAGHLSVIQDRTIYEDIYVFAPTLVAMRIMTRRDYDCLLRLFEQVHPFLQPPDVILYLRGSCDELLRRIRTRNRAYEQAIRPDYLEALNARYNAWAEGYDQSPLLTYDIQALDYAARPADLARIVREVKGALGKGERTPVQA